MAAKKKALKKRNEDELLITRVFDARRETVWKAWTEPSLLKRWWGPEHFTAPHMTLDLRVGGRSLFCMRSPEGKDYWSTGTYREIVPLKRIVTTDSFADKDGNVVPGSYYGMSPDFPMEMLVTVDFEDLGGKTRMTLRHIGMPKGPDMDGARLGWEGSFDKLAKLLAAR